MELIWTKTQLATLAIRSDYEGTPGGVPTTAPTDQTKWRIALLLLSKDGSKVCIFDDERENFRSWVAAEGELYAPDEILLAPEASNQCHQNCARLWKQYQDELSIVPGYALSDDGMWRQHTWIMDTSNNVVETTVPRVAYFGVRIDGEDAQRFYDSVMAS